MDDSDRLMRETLLGLAMTSQGRTASAVPHVSGSAPDSGGGVPPVDDPAARWAEKYDRAADGASRAAVLAGAREELRGIRRRRFPVMRVETADELSARIVSDGDGLDPLSVSIAMRCTPTCVRRARLAAGRDAETGRTVRLDALDPRALARAGMSVRQIAAVTGLPRSTAQDRLSA